MSSDVISSWKCHGGIQHVVEHHSTRCGVAMRFSIFLPPNVVRPPVLYFLSGLTCTWENATTKAGFQRAAAEHGVAVVCPDTSPRGPDVPDVAERWDLGHGAGFYVDATEPPWSKHFQMYSYVTEELPAFIGANFEVDGACAAVTGHSMGGHGALMVGLRNPERYRSVSAFSPIVAPSRVQWGGDAFRAYLGSPEAGRQYDATALIGEKVRPDIEIVIEQGTADEYLAEQLRLDVFERACEEAGQPLRVNRREGYDHSFYFVSSFIADHIALHAAVLNA